MKECKSCHAVYDEDINFCPKCGGKVEERVEVTVCPSCGAPVEDGVKFCGKCGAPMDGKKHCTACGRELADTDRFCPQCGTAVGGTARVATKSHSGGGAGSAVKRAIGTVKTFEANNKIIANAIVIILSVVFIFVALFAPVRVSASGMASTLGGNSYYGDEEVTMTSRGSSQSIFKIFGALGYINLDPENDKDLKKIREIMEEQSNASQAANKEFEAWYKRHENALDEEIADKMAAIVAKHGSDYNILGYTLAVTTVGAMNAISGSNVEASIADILDTQRFTAITALVFALITSLMQIAIAIFSIVMLIYAILGIVKKQNAKLFGSMTVPLTLSGVGLLLTSIAPLLAPGGAMLAICLTAAISCFVVGLARTLLCGGDLMQTLKRATVAALAIVTFFVLCTNLLSLKMTMVADGTEIIVKSISPLGATFESLFMFLIFKSVYGAEVTFSILSIVGALVMMLFSMVALILLLVWLCRSLARLANPAEPESSVEILALLGAIVFTVTAIFTAILGAVGEAPVTADSAVGVHCAFIANAPVYVSLAFAVAAFVFGLLFKPKKRTA